MAEAVPASVMMVRVGGQDYPYRRVAACSVCNSPYRMSIERALLQGWSYKRIQNSLDDVEHGPHPQPDQWSIRQHVTAEHMPLPSIARRKIIEKRAGEIGRNIEEDSELLLDTVTVNQMIIQRGFERMINGDLDVSMSDLMNALKLQLQIDQQMGETTDAQAWRDAMMEMLSTARRIMPPELWQRFGAEMKDSPIIAALQAKESKAVEGPDTT